MSEILAYGWNYANGPIALVPYGFRIPQFYTQLVDELVLDLYGEEPTDIRSIRVLLARQSAAVCDDMLFSLDFRLENLAVLDELVAQMKAEAEAEEAEDDENENIERSTNHGFDYQRID